MLTLLRRQGATHTEKIRVIRHIDAAWLDLHADLSLTDVFVENIGVRHPSQTSNVTQAQEAINHGSVAGLSNGGGGGEGDKNG